jgi:hypothetical protein
MHFVFKIFKMAANMTICLTNFVWEP